MWLEKLFDGVLRVVTPLGPRYVRPSFLQRIYLIWIFRNFHTLPFRVLSPSQQRRIEAMCNANGFVSVLAFNKQLDIPVLGSLEQRPPVESATPSRHPSQSISQSVAPFAADTQQQ